MDRKRVAAYCRVSSETKGQQSSFELQKQVYQEKISVNPEWELVAIYSDEGITGTNTKRREGFLQMMADASDGLIDLILTKSISRFARNTLDCLEAIRELQTYGVQVIFEKEGITTGEAFSEMLLTIMAAFAQEESRSLSENLKWGIRKRYEEGQDRWVSVYGYTSNEHGKYQIVEEEAEVVRTVYRLYEQGYSMAWIAEYLTSLNVPSPGNTRWDPSNISVFLNNEKYVGDIRLQKKYTVDHIEHKEIKNDGKVPSYYIQDHHTAIVDRKTYDRVQLIKKMRARGRNLNKDGHIQYPFGNLIKCPCCGGSLTQRKVEIQDAGSYLICENDGCKDFMVLSRFITRALLQGYNTLEMDSIEGLTKSGSPAARRQAELLKSYKQKRPSFQQVDYYWLDDLTEKIEIGRHASLPMVAKFLKGKGGYVEDDRTITIYWRCGLKTTVATGIEKDKDMPQCVLSLYRSKLERKA